jgi:hypothetical protein
VEDSEGEGRGSTASTRTKYVRHLAPKITLRFFNYKKPLEGVK